MSREIKFRAWIPRDPWQDQREDWEELSAGYEMCYDLAFEEYAPINDLLREVENLMQYTGLKDKNGKEIYEGDILRVFEYYCEEEPDLNAWKDVVVEWDDEGCCLSIEWNYGDYDITAIGWEFQNFDNSGCEVEVIGNIHENPELLSTPTPREQIPDGGMDE